MPVVCKYILTYIAKRVRIMAKAKKPVETESVSEASEHSGQITWVRKVKAASNQTVIPTAEERDIGGEAYVKCYLKG